MRTAGWAIVAAAFALVLAAPPARAAPQVVIKARTAIEVDPVRRDAGGIVVRGRVVDKFSRAPIGWVGLQVALDTLVRNVATDSAGHFEARFQVTTGRHDLIVTFDGDLRHDPSRFEMLGFDVTKNPLSLNLALSRAVASYGADTVELFITSETDFGGVPLPIQLTLADEDHPADVHPLPRVVTGADGKGKLELPPDRLGAPGRKVVVARYPGDDAYDRAEAQVSFLVKTDTTTQLTLGKSRIAYEDDLRGAGRVVDARGKGIADGAIAVMAGNQRIADTATGDDGRFSFSIAGSELGADKHAIQAIFEPSKDWQRGSRSTPPQLVEVAQPEPVPVSYTVAAFAAAALMILLFILARTRPWERWLTRLRARRAAPAERGEEADNDSGPERAVQTGLSLARPSLVSTLRRSRDLGFAGVVRDALSQRPVAGAALTLDNDAGEQRTASPDAAGRFAIEDLAPGRWTVSVSAHGYVTERFDITLPHRGELRGARIDLLAVRERIFALYGLAARPLLPDPELWGIWSPRQIFSHVRTERPPASAMSELTDFVEETYFSQRIPGEEQIGEARERIARVREETGA